MNYLGDALRLNTAHNFSRCFLCPHCLLDALGRVPAEYSGAAKDDFEVLMTLPTVLRPLWQGERGEHCKKYISVPGHFVMEVFDCVHLTQAVKKCFLDHRMSRRDGGVMGFLHSIFRFVTSWPVCLEVIVTGHRDKHLISTPTLSKYT